MKRPQKDDKLRIKSGLTSEIFEETCYLSRPDMQHAPHGIEFEIVTTRDYQLSAQYRLLGDSDEEIGASIISITPVNNPAWKRVAFRTLIQG